MGLWEGQEYSEDQERSYRLPADQGNAQLDIALKRLFDPKDWMSVEERAQLADTSGLTDSLDPNSNRDWAVFTISIDFLGNRRSSEEV